MNSYKIKITPITTQQFCAVKPYIIEVKTDNLEWYMEQYQRNRQAFSWEVINE